MPYMDAMGMYIPPKTNGWNLKKAPLEKETHLETINFGFHVSFLACNLYKTKEFWKETCKTDVEP